MAFAALVSLAQTIDLLLNHVKYSISVGEREKVISIREYVILLISFLEDFPEKASRLEGKIRDVANETEDIIEDFMWKRIRTSWWTVGQSRVEFECQLKKVTEEIGLIAGELMDDWPSNLPAATTPSRLAPTGENEMVIGLDDDLIAIKDRLYGLSSKFQVIPIVGMGGIGKTTLARNAYNDPLIMEHFEIRAWVTVSQDYSAREILSGLLDSMKFLEEQMFGQKNELTMAEMGEKVYKCLKGRRYLIVMDDVWRSKAWDDVRNVFPDDYNGSRIMLTTRLSDVAAYADPVSSVHKMKFMDENQSWTLLKQKVFTNGSGQDCPPELEDVGKDIARSCRGLPLAVVVVAGILSTVIKTRASWKKIAESVRSVIDGQVEEILYLSYKHLPHHLRPCFLLIGGFPEDYEIRVSRLIKLWVAEGFLKNRKGYNCLEEEAEKYLEDLVKRNLVLVTSRKKSNGKIKSCSLHDLVRDLCIRTAREEKFLVHVTDRYALPKIIKDGRHISTHHSHLINMSWSPSVHTILLYEFSTSELAFVGNFRLLRVLEVVNQNLKPLPPQVFELFHLRYLALGNYIRIPSAISQLENLQTLIIRPRKRRHRYLPSSSYLPSEIWRMPQLRHLVFVDFYLLPDPVDGSSLPLENLQTLSVVASLVCSERILKMIRNLKKLGIVYYDNQDRQFHNLINLYQLESLKVNMFQDSYWNTFPVSSWRGQNPAFPKTLKKLSLIGGRLPWENMAIVGLLPNLEVLKLRKFACDGATWETSEGEFRQLKFLLIEYSHLQYWITESSHFPRLECLVLHRCLRLSAIPDGIGDIPTLKLIEVDYMNPSLTGSAKQIQEDQQSYGNDTLQVHYRSHQASARFRYK